MLNMYTKQTAFTRKGDTMSEARIFGIQGCSLFYYLIFTMKFEAIMRQTLEDVEYGTQVGRPLRNSAIGLEPHGNDCHRLLKRQRVTMTSNYNVIVLGM